MIVCHCQNITDHEIATAIDWMRAPDPLNIIAPRKVYRALNKQADCDGCMPLFLDMMRRTDTFEVPILRQPGIATGQAPKGKDTDTHKATAMSSAASVKRIATS